MIPKKIHYVRLGGKEMPDLAKMCIASRKKYLPDYELCLWNEKNFDVNCNRYVKQAYNAKKFAFVWDYIRIRAMYTYGGISMDTDVEVIKNLDKFLDCKGFSGFENKDLVPTGIMAGERGNPFLEDLLQYYNNSDFNPENMITNVNIITNLAKQKYGFIGGCDELVKLKDEVFLFYPKNYFCPINPEDFKINYKKLFRDKDCYTIHWFAGSWLKISRTRRFFERLILYIIKKLHLYRWAKTLYDKYIK